MANLPIKSFLGLRVTADPEVGTAVVASNFKRNVVRGRIENVDGCSVINRTGYTTAGTLPSNDSNLGVSALAWKRPFSFYVADDGGSVIYAVVGTYTKTAHGITGTTVNTSGLWINRYHNGSAWVDGWRELTEFYIFRYASAANNGANQLDITLSNVGGVAPSTVASNVTEGFAAVKAGDFTNNDETGFKVVSMAGNVLSVTGQTGDIAGWSAGSTLIYVYRSVFSKVLPATVSSQIRNCLDEIRVTTGNGASDLDLSAFYRDKTYFPGNTLARKGTFGEYGHLSVPDRAFKLRNGTVNGSATAGFPKGAYTLRASMLMDDGQETELRDALVGQFPASLLKVKDTPLGNNAVVPICTDGTYTYVASFRNTGTYNYIWKLDSEGTILSTVQLTTASDGAPYAITYSGGFIYAMMNRTTDYRMIKFDTALQAIAQGSWSAAPQTSYMYGVGGPLGFYSMVQNGGQTLYQVVRHSYSTLNVDVATAVQNVSFTFGGYMAADGNYVLLMGGNHCYKYAAGFTNGANPTSDVYTGMGSVATTAAVIVGANAYVGATTKIKKWVLSTDTITDHWTGGLSNGWYGMCSDGTFLYGKNDTMLRKVDLSGTQLATYDESGNPLDLVYPVVVVGTNVYGLSIGGNFRMFSNIPASATFNSDGFVTPGFDIAVSPGYVPRRGKAIRVYVSKDGGSYYLIKEYSFLLGGETFSGTSVYDSTVKHRYFVSTGKVLTGANYSDATVTGTAQLGRIVTDAGILPYSFAITANNRTYAVGVFVGGRLIRNKVYINALSGDGISQFDVLPNDVTTILDVEFNDGDYAVALGNVADRILVLKNRSLVLLTPNSDGTHQRDIVATGVGIASPDSLVAFNETLYWLDHTGVWEFSTRGLVNKSEAITQTILGFTDSQRQAAIGVVDPANLLYRLFINNVWYVLDLKDGEWMQEQWHSSVYPLAACVDVGSVSRRYAWLTSAGSLWNPATATRFNSNNYTAAFQTNKIELPLERGFDGLVSAIYCDYSSSVALTLSLYLNDAGSPVRSWTLPSNANGVVVPAPLSARCKSFRLEIGATTTADAQTFSVRRLGAYFNQIPVGGDKQTI